MISLATITKYPIHWALGGTAQVSLEQNPNELLKFCHWLERHKIKSILEIGAGCGYFNIFMNREMGIPTKSISIHMIEGIDMIWGRSQDQPIIDSIGNYDLVFVDGDHAYEMVSSDFFNYKDKCKYMAFHDILGLRGCEGVRMFWNDLHDQWDEIWEFIDDDLTIASGIGVIKL